MFLLRLFEGIRLAEDNFGNRETFGKIGFKIPLQHH